MPEQLMVRGERSPCSPSTNFARTGVRYRRGESPENEQRQPGPAGTHLSMSPWPTRKPMLSSLVVQRPFSCKTQGAAAAASAPAAAGGPGAAPASLTPSPCSAARYSPATISLCSSRNSASSAITGAAAPSGRARTPAGAPGRDRAAQQCRPGRFSPPGKRREKGCRVKALQNARTRAARGAQSLSEGRSRGPNPPLLRTCPAHPTAGPRRGARVSLPSRQRPCLPLPAAGSHGATSAVAGVERGLKPRRRPGRHA